jgi:hypothetical protein
VVVTPPPNSDAPDRKSSESPTIPPPPRRRSFYDPSLFFIDRNSPAQVDLGRLNSLPSTPTTSFHNRALVFADNSSQPSGDDEVRPLNLADYPPGTRVSASEAKRLFPGDMFKVTLAPNYANCRDLPPSDPLNWIIPFPLDQGTVPTTTGQAPSIVVTIPAENNSPSASPLNIPVTVGVQTTNSSLLPQPIDSGIRAVVLYDPQNDPTYHPSAPSASSSVSNLVPFVAPNQTERQFVPGSSVQQQIVTQPEQLTGLGFFSRSDDYSGPWGNSAPSQEEVRYKYYLTHDPWNLDSRACFSPPSDYSDTDSRTSLDLPWCDTSELYLENPENPTTTVQPTIPTITTVATSSAWSFPVSFHFTPT